MLTRAQSSIDFHSCPSPFLSPTQLDCSECERRSLHVVPCTRLSVSLVSIPLSRRFEVSIRKSHLLLSSLLPFFLHHVSSSLILNTIGISHTHIEQTSLISLSYTNTVPKALRLFKTRSPQIHLLDNGRFPWYRSCNRNRFCTRRCKMSACWPR
jgi:hypothetical protein